MVVSGKGELRNTKGLVFLRVMVDRPDSDLLVSSSGNQDGLDVVLDLEDSRDNGSDHLFVSLNVEWLFNLNFADFVHGL